jgi:hypothetical protein
VATNEQAAKAGVKVIERLKPVYLDAVKSFNEAVNGSASEAAQKALLDRLYQAATDAFNATDQAVSESDLLGANRSGLWATDLAATAVNTLYNVTQLYARVWEEADRLHVSRPQPGPTAFYSMQSAATTYFPRKARTLRQKFAKLGLPTEGFDNPTAVNTRYKNWEKIVMIATVVVFLLILLAIGVFMKPKDLNNFNIFLFRTVLSLVGAAFGAIFVPGAIKVRKFGVTAAGAAAFFVIIFFTNPPALVKNTVQSNDSAAPAANQ